MNDEKKIEVLLENYKLISEETKNYLSEMIRCFLYAAVVLGIGLGYGENVEEIIEYMPLAFLVLIIYFLTLGFMYINANRYKAQIEYKINRIAKDGLLEFESIYKPELFKTGFLPVGKNSKRLLPLPNFFLGVIVFLIFVFLNERIKYSNLYLIVGLIIVLFGIYIFLVIPRVIEKHQKRKEWIE